MANSTIIKIVIPAGLGLFCLIMISGNLFPLEYNPALASVKKNKNLLAAVGLASSTPEAVPVPELDFALYDKKMLVLANNATSTKTASSTATTTKRTLWPVKTVYPKVGAILPFKRIVAYYGNLYSKNMGVLGEYSEAEVFRRLDIEVKKWELVDPETPVQPALHYIVATAQGSPGEDGMYRFRMPDEQIDKVLAMAKKIDAIVFLDIQVGLSNFRTEIPHLEKYLKMPNVHLGLDPEFSMKTGAKPGTVIGTMSSADINYAINYLATVVKENNLPPKILIIHRFTQPMVTGYKNIKLVPEVQFVMDMDGWGTKERKIDSYQAYVQKEPVQFTGFKLFYKNDFRQPGSQIMTPKQLMKLQPRPIYIQYQ